MRAFYSNSKSTRFRFKLPGMSELAIKLNDGLDLRLSIAGPGARAYAFLLDFKFRVLAALLWLGIGMTIFHLLGRNEFANIFEERQKPFLITVIIPIPYLSCCWAGARREKSSRGFGSSIYLGARLAPCKSSCAMFFA